MDKIFFRVDANETVAMGHLMRCLTIADAARNINIESVFLLADNKAEEVVKKYCYSYLILNTDWRDMNGEIPKIRDVIRDHNVEYLIIDSYQVTENYLRNLQSVATTLYIDDLNKFKYPVDCLLCYEYCCEKYNYPETYTDSNVKLMLGTKYAPLRKGFSSVKTKPISRDIKSILILSGGSDPYHVIERMLD